MEYVPCLKVALNDVKALINLESHRKARVAPLIEMRGKETDPHLRTFLDQWGDTSFFFDFSLAESATTTDPWFSNLLLQNDAFKTKRNFLSALSNHPNLIPVISWQEQDTLRNVTQFALRVEERFSEIAIRINMQDEKAWPTATSVLSAVREPENITIILDYQDSPPNPSAALKVIGEIKTIKVKRFVLLSTSFPNSRPPSGNEITALCTDIDWQSQVKLKAEAEIIFGDYAANTRFSTMEYRAGMVVIPSACYFSPPEWWLRREGTDKEFIRFRDIAKALVTKPFFHGEDYCWATQEIVRISQLPPSTTGGHGTNGNWNGYKSNQHICAMLDYLASPSIEESEDNE